MNLDFSLFEILNNFAGKSVCLDSFFIFFAEYFGYILIFILLLFSLKNFKKYWFMTMEALVSAITARFFITEIIRLLWHRPRPFVENNVNLLFSHPATGSFPSGHAAFFFGLSTVVYLYNKKAGILFFAASFFISISRVVAGVHWPSDILAGAAVGIITGFIVNFLAQNFIAVKKK